VLACHSIADHGADGGTHHCTYDDAYLRANTARDAIPNSGSYTEATNTCAHDDYDDNYDLDHDACADGRGHNNDRASEVPSPKFAWIQSAPEP